jgi:hypothetical protein
MGCSGSSVSVGQSKLCHSLRPAASATTRLPVSRSCTRSAPVPLVLVLHATFPSKSTSTRDPSLRNSAREPLPLRAASRSAVHATVASAERVNQTANVYALVATLWKPQEKLPLGDTRAWLEASSTAMESPGHRMLSLALADEARRKAEVRMISALIMVPCRAPDARAIIYIYIHGICGLKIYR